jgi:hypothetical protein
MNIVTGWTLPLLIEGAVAVSGATPGRFGSGSAAALMVTASCGVVGLAILVFDYLAAITVVVMLCLGYNLFKVSSKFISIPMCMYTRFYSLNSWIFYVH